MEIKEMNFVHHLNNIHSHHFIFLTIIFYSLIRSNLSLSPEESWLPIASILLCIIHIQVSWEISCLLIELFTRGFAKFCPGHLVPKHFWTPTHTVILKYCSIGLFPYAFFVFIHNLAFTCSLKWALEMEISNPSKYLEKLPRKFLQLQEGETISRGPKDHPKR